MFVLGLVGTPAAGKSTVAEYLAGLGAEWINADLIARECLELPEVTAPLVERWGRAILTAEGRIDRRAVADRVFGEDATRRDNRQFLESLVHPLTREQIMRRVAQAARRDRTVALLDIPLLFESGWDRGCDAVWCVDASRSVRLARAQARGWDQRELDRRESNQLAIETKSRLSHVVMRNETTLEALHEKLRCHWDRLARIMGGSSDGTTHSTTRHCISDREPGRRQGRRA
jgi:dephospho-CoA kinase